MEMNNTKRNKRNYGQEKISMEVNKNKRIKKNNEEDKISSLPKDLLVLITSNLPFKEAARTSVLAKKWGKLWPHTGNVDLDEKFFVQAVEESDESKENHRRDFIKFAKKWCQSAKQDIHSFRLVFSNPGNYINDLQEFVKYAIDHNVKNLELDFSDPSWDENSHVNQDPVFELPNFVYQHQGLESIKLFSCNVNVFKFKNPSGIKSFSLGWANLSKNQLQQFLAKCQFLEDLSLKKCWNVGELTISAPRLNSLVLDKCSDLGRGIDIYAERMKYFKYSGEVINFTFDYFRTLEAAEIDFSNEDAICENVEYLFYDLLKELWSGKVLTVCSYLLQFIAPVEEDYPNFECVRHLTMKAGLYKEEYNGISYMLTCCPNLETLTFDMSQPRIFQGSSFGSRTHPFLLDTKYDAFGTLFKCLKSSLKVVEIKGFKGEHYETKAIQYLIRHGKTLEKIHIFPSKEHRNLVSSIYRLKVNTLMNGLRASKKLKFVIES